MAIGMGQIIAIGLRIVAKRKEIGEVWDTVAPLVQAVRKNYPALKDLIDEVAPEPLPLEPSEFSVEWLQESLNALGYGPLEVDGDYGNATKAAVVNYQKDHGLVVDSWAGIQTQASIHEELAK